MGDCKAEIPLIDPLLYVLVNLHPAERATIASHLRRGAGNCIGIIRFVALLVFVLSTSSWGVDPYCRAL
jgi:hypothetical protein